MTRVATVTGMGLIERSIMTVLVYFYNRRNYFWTAYLGVKCTNLLSINLNISDIVLKHCWNVDFRKLVFTEDNEKTCFPTSSIPDDHKLLPNGSHLCWEKRRCFKRLSQTDIPQKESWVSKLSAVPQKKLFCIMVDFTCHAARTSQTTLCHPFLYFTLQIFKLFEEITGTQD